MHSLSGVAWCGVAWRCMALHGVAWRCMALHCMALVLGFISTLGGCLQRFLASARIISKWQFFRGVFRQL